MFSIDIDFRYFRSLYQTNIESKQQRQTLKPRQNIEKSKLMKLNPYENFSRQDNLEAVTLTFQ